MAEDKKGFLVYCDLIHTVKLLPDEIAGKLFKHLLSYVNDEEPETENFMVKLAFEPIKQSLKRDLQKWEGKKSDMSKNGKIGNLKRYNKDVYDEFKDNKITLNEALDIAESRKGSPPDQPRSTAIAKLAVKDSVSVSVKDSVSVSVNKTNKVANARKILEDKKELFQNFWDIYNKKTGKETVLKKWLKLSQEEMKQVFIHLPKYVDSTPDKSFRKNPLTYLNQKSFNDEIITKTTAGTNTDSVSTRYRKAWEANHEGGNEYSDTSQL